MKDNFIEFLNKNRSYSAFNAAYANEGRSWSLDKYLDYMIECGDIDGIFSGAFHWASTKQGHDFWIRLQHDWYAEVLDV
jgi:hypothetical protein